MGTGIGSGEVLDDAGDDLWLGDVREDAKWRRAARTTAQTDTEGATQSLHPTQAGARWRS